MEAIQTSFRYPELENPNAEYLGFAQAYHLFDKPTSNSEILSLMKESDYPLNEYLDNFLTRVLIDNKPLTNKRRPMMKVKKASRI